MFMIKNECVVFKRAGDGQLFTPIFPKDSRVVGGPDNQSAILIGTSTIQFETELRLGGGYYDTPEGGGVRLGSPVPNNCPKSYWLVGAINR